MLIGIVVYSFNIDLPSTYSLLGTVLDVGYSLKRRTVKGLSSGSLQSGGGTGREREGWGELSKQKRHHVFLTLK